jgi:penicillin-binding protein-related factor A (putative recombinase)
MAKPSDYPAVEDMSIKALKDLVYRLEREQVQTRIDEWDGISDRSDRLVKEADVPMTVWERAERYPTKAVYDIDGPSHPQVITDWDWISFYAMCFLPMFIFMGLLALIALYDF